jgi:hypothetical protein
MRSVHLGLQSAEFAGRLWLIWNRAAVPCRQTWRNRNERTGWVNDEPVQTEVRDVRLLRNADGLPDGAHGPKALRGPYSRGPDGSLRSRLQGVSAGRGPGRLEAVSRGRAQLRRADLPQVGTGVPGSRRQGDLQFGADLGTPSRRARGTIEGGQGNPAGDPLERRQFPDS